MRTSTGWSSSMEISRFTFSLCTFTYGNSTGLEKAIGTENRSDYSITSKLLLLRETGVDLNRNLDSEIGSLTPSSIVRDEMAKAFDDTDFVIPRRLVNSTGFKLGRERTFLVRRPPSLFSFTSTYIEVTNKASKSEKLKLSC